MQKIQTQAKTEEQVKGLSPGKGNHDPNKQQIDETTESFRNFLRKFRNSPKTKETYINWIRRYVWYSNLPEVKAKLGVSVGDNTDLLLFDDTRKIQNHIKQYLDYQYEVMHISPRSASSYYIAVKHFYESNEVTLNWHVMMDYAGTVTNVSANLDLPWTYEEIHRLLDKCDERKRLCILLLCSSGVRRQVISELKVGDLKWIDQYQIYEITVYKGFKEEYKTYCSVECSSAIRSYLDFRRRHGEQVTEDSYLIRKQFNTTDKNKVLYKRSDATDPPQKHKVSMKNIESMIYKLIYESGIRNYNEKKTRLGDRHKNMMTHSCRKFFENKCLEAGVDPFYVSVLMGHKAGIGVERHYYRPGSINGEYSLLELYTKKAMPYLTISDESRLKLKNRELEMRMKEDEERIKHAIEEARRLGHDDAIAVMGDRIGNMQRQIDELMKAKNLN